MRLESFAFKKAGSNAHMSMVYDARVLPNPYNQAPLRKKDGRNPTVQRFLLHSTKTHDLIQAILADCHAGARHIGVGCVGGCPRSVAVVELAAAQLQAEGYKVEIVHRDL